MKALIKWLEEHEFVIEGHRGTTWGVPWFTITKIGFFRKDDTPWTVTNKRH